MRKITLTILITIIIVSLGKSQTLNVPDNIETSTNVGNVGIGTTTPNTKLEVYGTHTTAKFRLFSIGNGSTLNSSLDMWASEPGVTYDGAGIGTNVNGHPHYGRRNSSLYQSYIRFQNGSIAFSTGAGDAVESVRIIANGNVGIGTTSTDYKLEINGTVGISGHFTSLRASSNTFLRNDDNGFTGYGSASSLSSGANILLYGKSSSRADVLAFRNSGGEKMTIDANGNVGIGTSPSVKLEVKGTTTSNHFKIGAGVRDLTFSTESNISVDALHRLTIASVNGAFAFNNANGELVRFDESGSVAIGTIETGTHKLAVDGTIGAREIVVETGVWSDFVFNKNYKLKDLEEVENFIKENNHLPDIPSEKEVLENGIQVGEMNAKLLQKIEELTLYLIEQNKEIKELKEEVKNLKETTK